MKTFTVEDIEQAAKESEQDRRDHRALRDQLDELLGNDHAMRVALAVKRLVDGGIDPVVVAKTLLIGNRSGGKMYELSSRAAAIDRDEQAAELWLIIAIRDIDAATAAMMLVTGAAWLATQFTLDRQLLKNLVQHATRRERRIDRLGYGAVDFVDHEGIANRSWLIGAIDHAQLPSFAPLEYKPT